MSGQQPYSKPSFSSSLRAAVLGLARTLAGVIWIGSALVAGGVISAQSLHWLRAASWPAWTLIDGLEFARLPTPTSNWLGVEKILSWLLTFPLSLALLLSGFALAVAVVSIGRILLGNR